ncbi:hypothetical protein SLE2022_348020 [Rubroshorea leprosula]
MACSWMSLGESRSFPKSEHCGVVITTFNRSGLFSCMAAEGGGSALALEEVIISLDDCSSKAFNAGDNREVAWFTRSSSCCSSRLIVEWSSSFTTILCFVEFVGLDDDLVSSLSIAFGNGFAW